jgi:hypothetical protein
LKFNKNGILPLILFIGITILCANRPAHAQEGESFEFKSTLNYAFATQLGSGIYRVSGRTVQIYRLSVAIQLLSSEERGWGLWLRLPVTLGFYNFKVEDVLESGFPSNLSTLALVPTVEFFIPARKNWWLGPFGGLGIGRDFSNSITNYIYAAGIKSMAIFLWGPFDIRLGNRLVYSGYTTRNLSFEDDFAVFETGLDFRRPIGIRIGRYHLDGSIFGANYLYFVSPNVIRLKPDPSDTHAEWETGITFGTVEPLKFLGLGMPRVGLSYRFVPGANAIRIIIGNPFPIDSPRDRSPEVN